MTNLSTHSIHVVSEDESLALPGNVVESLVSPSCDPKEIVVQLKENLYLDRTDLEQPTTETKRQIRYFVAIIIMVNIYTGMSNLAKLV